MALYLLALFLASSVCPAANWPMWRHDVGRTAESPQQLPADLKPLWQRDLPKPRPAFQDVRLQSRWFAT